MPLRDVVSTRRSPGLRPRWCPEYSPYRIQDCCFPTHCNASAFSHIVGLYKTTTIHISGLNTEPVEHPGICGASLPPPASDSRYRACLRIQLLTPPASLPSSGIREQARALRAGCWPDFSQVGLSRTRFRREHYRFIKEKSKSDSSNLKPAI